MKRKVVVSGYYGFGNIGDEAILASIVRRLNEYVPDLSVTVLSNSNSVYLSEEFDVKCVNRMSPLAITREISSSDLFISGGGGLLQDITGLNSVRYYLGLVKLAKVLKKKVMYYAQGIGPLNSPGGIKLVKDVSNKIDLITVRDQESSRLLSEIGVTVPPIIVTADPVISLEGDAGLGKYKIFKDEGIHPGEKAVVAISVRPWKAELDYVCVLADAVAAIRNTHDIYVLLIPFQKTQDLEVCEKLAVKIEKDVSVIMGDYRPEEMISLISSVDVLLAMRLHALIFAASGRTAMAGLVYDPKVRIFSQLLNIPHWSIEELDVTEISAAVNNMLSSGNSLKKDIAEKVSSLHSKSVLTARIAAELMEGVPPETIAREFSGEQVCKPASGGDES